jgi:hypothetical protein
MLAPRRVQEDAMRNPLVSRLETIHLVDEHGMVCCPRGGADVCASRCLSCVELLIAVRDADGQLIEIRCVPPSRTTRAPWDLMQPS